MPSVDVKDINPSVLDLPQHPMVVAHGRDRVIRDGEGLEEGPKLGNYVQ